MTPSPCCPADFFGTALYPVQSLYRLHWRDSIPEMFNLATIEEFQAICRRKYGRELSYDETLKASARVIRFIELTEIPGRGVLLTDEEQEALTFITSEIQKGCAPSVRGIAAALGELFPFQSYA